MTQTGFSGSAVLMARDAATVALWRAAVMVYRRAMADHGDKEWLCAAASAGAVMALAPEMGWAQASQVAREAVAAVSVRWPEWMWSGEGKGPDWSEAGGKQIEKS